ncbi:MAG TPA: methylenetetrahydrofolate reductase [Candidatus Krumholzibacteria bacterium]|nr:methylenetetrahydrofolate reductase [Candidatus Krumholzibacteria bacterium]
MHVTEHLDRADRTLFSFEIIPPLRGGTVRDIIDIVEQVAPLKPPFIDVTSHSAEAVYDELPDGTIKRRVRKKRPGTISICGIIQNRWGIDTVPHLLCTGFTREETEDAVIELNYLGIHNVLAIRGDESNYAKAVDQGRSRNLHARDLVAQLADLGRGRFLDDLNNTRPIPFCVGVGGYPEKHIEAPNLKTDIRHLQAKVDAGAHYVVSQMFFDNAAFLDWTARCREAGITVPIIPGIKLIDNVRQLTSLPKHFHVTIPDELVDEIQASPAHVKEIGRRWARRQVEGLIAAGSSCLHFYVMNDASPVVDMIRDLA